MVDVISAKVEKTLDWLKEQHSPEEYSEYIAELNKVCNDLYDNMISEQKKWKIQVFESIIIFSIL